MLPSLNRKVKTGSRSHRSARPFRSSSVASTRRPSAAQPASVVVITTITSKQPSIVVAFAHQPSQHRLSMNSTPPVAMAGTGCRSSGNRPSPLKCSAARGRRHLMRPELLVDVVGEVVAVDDGVSAASARCCAEGVASAARLLSIHRWTLSTPWWRYSTAWTRHSSLSASRATIASRVSPASYSATRGRPAAAGGGRRAAHPRPRSWRGPGVAGGGVSRNGGGTGEARRSRPGVVGRERGLPVIRAPRRCSFTSPPRSGWADDDRAVSVPGPDPQPAACRRPMDFPRPAGGLTSDEPPPDPSTAGSCREGRCTCTIDANGRREFRASG